jgi:hypothetical protein
VFWVPQATGRRLDVAFLLLRRQVAEGTLVKGDSGMFWDKSQGVRAVCISETFSRLLNGCGLPNLIFGK